MFPVPRGYIFWNMEFGIHPKANQEGLGKKTPWGRILAGQVNQERVLMPRTTLDREWQVLREQLLAIEALVTTALHHLLLVLETGMQESFLRYLR